MTGPSGRASPPPLFTPGFAALMLAMVGFGYAFSTFFLLPKFLNTELGAGPTEVGLAMGAYGVVVVALVPIMGAVVDRRGRRNFLTAGATLMAFSAFAFATVEQMGPMVYALRALQGLAFAMAFAAGAALAVDLAPPERVAQAIGLFGITFLSMNAIAPAVAEEVAGRAGWAWALGSAGAGALLCAVLSRRLRDVAGAPDPAEVPPLRAVLFRPSQLRLFAVVALAGAGLGGVFTFHQLFAEQLGIENVRAFFVAYAIAAVSVRIFLGRQVDRVGRRRVAIFSLALYVPMVAAMAKLETLGLAPIGLGIGLAHGLFYPSLNAVAIEEAGENERGKVMALFQAAFNVGFAGSNPALGMLAEIRGYPPVFATGAVCLALALVILVASPEGRRARNG